MLVLLGGCSLGSGTAAAPAASGAASASPTTTADSGNGGDSGSPASSSSDDTSPGDNANGDKTPRCHSGDLAVTIKDADGGGTAGGQVKRLYFTNKTADACSMYGYPGVSFVTGDDGRQVGSAFKRVAGDKKYVDLNPRGNAFSELLIADPGAAGCATTSVRGLRIYPPDETAATFVRAPMKACTEQGKGVGQVKPVSR